jgi:hypothetical protein
MCSIPVKEIHLFRLVLLLMLATAAASGADRVRLVLDSGWVLNVSADGTRVLSDPVKLELPKPSKGILSFQVDHARNHLYVTPDGPYESRGTQVFELSTLRLLGFMPGVTKVIVPVDPTAPKFTTIIYTVDDTMARGSPLTSLEQLHHDRMSRQTVELRDRRVWNKVDSARSGNPGFDLIAMWQCYSGTGQEYLSQNPNRSYQLQAGVAAATAAKEKDLGREAGENVLTAGCWPNGDTLLVGRDKFGLPPSKTTVTVSKRSRKGELKKFTTDTTWRVHGLDHAVFVTLGANSRYAAYLDYFGTFILFDFDAMTRSTPAFNGNPLFGQFSAKRDEWYVPAVQYSYKGNTDWDYIWASAGSWRETNDTLHRFSVNGTPRAETLRFPREVTEINYRESELNNIRERDDLTEEQKKRLIDELPPLGALGSKIQHVGIIGAIAE